MNGVIATMLAKLTPEPKKTSGKKKKGGKK